MQSCSQTSAYGRSAIPVLSESPWQGHWGFAYLERNENSRSRSQRYGRPNYFQACQLTRCACKNGPRHERFGWFKKRTPVWITMMPNGFPPSREWQRKINHHIVVMGSRHSRKTLPIIPAKAGIHKDAPWIDLLEVFWAVFCFILVWKFAR